ncbi:MAG: tyrosine--tRNA ligase, partial [Amphritea sp.]|nr:tyrosine--tRNA ligase [Amphritea sp.]
EAQSLLAREVTRLVHGEEGLTAAMRITDALFSGNLSDLSEADFEQLQLDGLPSSSLADADLAETPLTTLLSEAGMANSGKQIKDALQRNAVIVNGVEKGMGDNMKAAEIFASEHGTYGRFFLVKLGKKKHHLFVI